MAVYAPILLFVYNRLAHVQEVIKALQQNFLASESELFVYSDAARTDGDIELVKSVRNYIRKVDGFKRVTIEERKENCGLAANIIDGVTEVVNQYGKVIVLEDDLVTSPYFLTFMNDALDVYENEDKVGNVHGHVFKLSRFKSDTFLIRFADSWGWGTWKRAWKLFEPDGSKLLAGLEAGGLCKEFDFNGAYRFTRMLKKQITGENNSWAIRWNASLFLNNKLAVNAGKSLVENIGFDGSGTHCGRGHIFKTDLYSHRIPVIKKDELVEEIQAREAMHRMYRWQSSKLNKILKRINAMLS